MTDEFAFWAAVGLVAVAAVAMFKLLAGQFGARFPALADLAAFV
jgi:hypothetical protein